MNATNSGEINPDTVLVLGATGRQGGAVARALIARSVPVRALVRDTGSTAARSLIDLGVGIVDGDFADAGSLSRAMTDVGGVFSVQPNSGSPGSGMTDAEEVRIGKMTADLAVQSGVSHLVYSSASIIGRGPTGVANLDCKLEVEAHVRALPIATTIVRPATFMELLANSDLWSASGVLAFFASPEQEIELVAVDDIGRAVSGAFHDRSRFSGKTLSLAGDRLSGIAVQSAMRKAVSNEITYERFADAVLAKQPALARTVELFDSGRATDGADIPALEEQFGPFMRLNEWLVRTGKGLIVQAMASKT